MSEHGVAPDPDKVACIVSMPRPTNSKDFKSVVGMSAYYCRFIDNFAANVRPLHALTKKRVFFLWIQER